MSVPYYPGSLFTPNLGLALFGMDEVLAQNFVLLDAASGGSTVDINGVAIATPNFNDLTPAAPVGKTNVKWQVDGSGNVSAYVPASAPGGSDKQVQFNDGGTLGGASGFQWSKTIPAAIITNDLTVSALGKINGIVYATFTTATAPVAANGASFLDVSTTSAATADITGFNAAMSVGYQVKYNADDNGQNYAFLNALMVPDSSTHTLGETYSIGTVAANYGSGDVFSMEGVISFGQHSGSGTVDFVIGLDGEAFNTSNGNSTDQAGVYAASNNQGTGTITRNYGVWVDVPTLSSATTHNYGIFIGDQTGGGANNPDPWALYTDGGKVRIKGALVFAGSSSGSASIQVAAAAGTPNALVLPTTTGTSGQVLSTNGANPQLLSWVTPTAAPVSSVFGRVGTVVAASNDYSFAQLSGKAGLAQGGTNVDLSASGSATAFLAQDGSHVVSARSLAASDLPSSTSPAFALPAAVTSFNAYGDSITSGYQLPGLAASVWATVFADMVGIAITNNYAVVNATLDNNGFIPNANQNNPTAAVGSLIGGISNHLSSVPTSTSQVISSLNQMMVWLALPNSAKVLATAMTQVGSWSTTGLFNLTAEFSTAVNATLTGTANGTTVYFAYWTNSAYGTGDLIVDGVTITSINFATTYTPTGGGSFTPALIRVAGLSSGNHTVQIKCTTNGKVTNCLWIAGNQGTPQTPWVGMGACIPRTGLTSNVTTLNTAIAAAVANLVADGLNVSYVDVGTSLSLTATPSQYQDGIHPNYYGATKLAGAWLAGLYPAASYPAVVGKNGDALAQTLFNAGITPGTLAAVLQQGFSTGVQSFANGTEANPAIAFGPVSTLLSGIWSNSAPVLGMSISGVTQLLLATNIARMPSTGAFGFCSGAAGGTSTDTAVSRVSAGVMGLGTGAAGAVDGTLKLTILNAVTGVQINGAATSGNVLRGNGTNFVSAQLALSDLSGTANPAQLPSAMPLGLMSYMYPAIGSITNFTVMGHDTSTSFGTAGGNGGGVGQFIGITTTGATKSGYNGSLCHPYNGSPFMSTFWGLGVALTNTLSWVGLTDQNGTLQLGGTVVAGNYAMFRYANGTDTNIKCITCDGVTQTVVDSGTPPVVGTLYKLTINCDSANSRVLFYINSTLVATITTHLPTAATAMSWFSGIVQSSGSGNQIFLGRIYVFDQLA